MHKESYQILIVDDDRAVCKSLDLLLTRSGYDCTCIFNAKQIEPTLLNESIDLVLLDLNFSLDTSGRKGLQALKLIRTTHPKLPVILMTGWATVQLAVEGMKLGASDFVAKPWENKSLLESIKTILALAKRANEGTPRLHLDQIIGESQAIQDILKVVKTVSKTKASVLILGESGTGKELIAEAIHHSSARNNAAFIKVNLGGLSHSLFESEMFGHKRGSFTDAIADRIGRFEAADKGTIFLDEIGDLEFESQVKLLRVLQESTFEPVGSSTPMKVDVRVIAATNLDLDQMMAEGRFREDLYYRLNLVTITLPPLRDRIGDIPLLAQYFLDIYREYYQKPELTFSTKALRWLTKQKFGGNIRQLRNLIEKAAIFSNESTVAVDILSTYYRDLDKPQRAVLPDVGSISLEDLEREMIQKALQKYNHKVADAAKALGLTRSSMYRRIEKYNLLP